MNFLQRDSFLTRVLSRLIDCMLLSILWLFTSIPVVTIGASTTAAYSVALKLAAGEHPALVSGYFAAFKKNILRSTAVFLALTGTGLFIGLDLWCVLQWETPFQFALEVLILSVGFFYLILATHAFPALAFYEGKPDVLLDQIQELTHQLITFVLQEFMSSSGCDEFPLGLRQLHTGRSYLFRCHLIGPPYIKIPAMPARFR